MDLARRRAAITGALILVMGAAAAEGVAAALGVEPGPTRLVAAWIRDAVPGKLAIALVHLVGSWDKPLLVAGTFAGLAGLGAVAGASRRSWLWRVVCVLLAVVGALGVGTQGGGLRAAAAVAVAFAIWWWAPRLVLGSLVPSQTAEADPGRRRFVLRLSAVALASAAVAAGGWLMGRKRSRVEAARAMLRLPADPGVEPNSADLGLKGVTAWRTPNDSFYRIDTALSVPTISPSAWQLRIHGMVEREVRLTYEQLVSRGLSGAWVTLTCVSNEIGGDLIGNAWWTGVPVRDLLAEAGVRSGADAVKQTSADGWTCGTPLSALTDDRNALVAIAMNGSPLPIEHGFPARLVVPGLYGYVSATKWVVDLEVTRFSDFTAYWTGRGWAEQAPIKLASRIDVPRAGAELVVGVARFGGVAWAQHRGIAKVEVQLDGGPWRQAVLGAGSNDDTWVQWSITADLVEGDHVLVVRATDKLGHTQTAVRRDVVPDGATGWHTVEFTAS